jgi:hypothetical protein
MGLRSGANSGDNCLEGPKPLCHKGSRDMRFKRVHLPLLAAIASALVLSQIAAAGQMPVRFNAVDQAAARIVVLKNADLGGVAGWKGGLRKTDFSQSACGGYAPKHSDLLVTGAAASDWQHASGLVLMSEVWVLKTPAMVTLDWKRTVTHADYLNCVMTQAVANEPGTRLISFKQTAFPKLGSLSARYRLVVEYTDRKPTTRVMFDTILIGKGRTEITLLAVAPYSDRQVVEAAELRLARAMANRATA